MKSAKELARGVFSEDDVERVIREAQADALEAAALRMEELPVYAVDIAQDTKRFLIAEVRKLKETP